MPVQISQKSAAQSVIYAAPSEEVRMNRWHFVAVLRRMKSQESSRPHGEWCLIPLAMFLGVMQPLLTSDFKAAFGVGKDVWHALAILIAGLTGVATIALFFWWFGDKCVRRVRSPEEIVEDVIKEMTGV